MLLHVPHIHQREKADCLVACVAMVIEYWQIKIAYEQIARILKTQSFGTSARSLGNLQAHGITVRYREGSWLDLEQHLSSSVPCITLVYTASLPYWQETTNHAVVVVGLSESEVYLNDPAFEYAPQTVSRAAFELVWMDFDYRFGALWPSGTETGTID
jgi:ABC-type bacteriocin/lantibiotic exporter with double-glycine peptidase domain